MHGFGYNFFRRFKQSPGQKCGGSNRRFHFCTCGNHRAGKPLDHQWGNADFAQGAIDFLNLALEGAENYGLFNFPGGMGRVIESLTLFGWAVEALFGLTTETVSTLSLHGDRSKLKESVLILRGICEKWQKDEALEKEETEKLVNFFLSIARITLREAGKFLSFPC